MDETVTQKIKRIEKRLDEIERIVKTMFTPTSSNQKISLTQKDLLALPGSLQKTMLAIQELEDATSTDVSVKTGRARSVETIYLNQLARLGYLTKERRGRKIYFKIIRYY